MNTGDYVFYRMHREERRRRLLRRVAIALAGVAFLALWLHVEAI